MSRTKTNVFMNLTESDSVLKIEGNELVAAALIAAILDKHKGAQDIFRAAIRAIDRVNSAKTNN